MRTAATRPRSREHGAEIEIVAEGQSSDALTLTHSMTCVACSRTAGGIVRPSAWRSEVDDQLELRGLLHGQLVRLPPLRILMP